MPKLRVGVLMGGKSIEREVSFNSGRTVCDHLDTERYDIIPLFQMKTGQLYLLPWHFLHRGKTNDFEHRLAREAQTITWDDLSSHVDFVYIATHGRYAEDGTLQGTLELLGIPYLGSSRLSSALCMDKHMTKLFLQQAGIDVPRGIVITPEHVGDLEALQKYALALLKKNNITQSVVIKPHNEGSSLGISVLTSYDNLAHAITKACTIHEGTRQSVIVEEKLKAWNFHVLHSLIIKHINCFHCRQPKLLLKIIQTFLITTKNICPAAQLSSLRPAARQKLLPQFMIPAQDRCKRSKCKPFLALMDLLLPISES